MSIEVENYINLLTSEHINRKNFISYNLSYLNKVKSACSVFDSFYEKFDIDKAEGDQLDKIASYFNLSRSVSNSDTTIPDKLSDEDFRIYIKSVAIFKNWDGTLGQIKERFLQLFPGSIFVIKDNQDMSIEYEIINPTYSDVVGELIVSGFIIPKPSGVKVVYTQIKGYVFGYDESTDAIRGYDEGYWL